tara:strand:- start:1262 stop:1414 length:153 start_codon:yes stop_codon:yes gene_type:complete
MQTVSYDVVLELTVEIDASDLIDESARDLVLSGVDEMGQTKVHTVEITVA